MNAICYLALGSNVGNRQGFLQAARTAIAGLRQTRILDCSQDHLTRPVGGPAGQNDYLNAALKIETAYPPQELLEQLLAIEQMLGRNRMVEGRNGPRTIDIDILFYNDIIYTSSQLTIPHPRMDQRAFVLMPLCDIAPDLIHPVLGCPISLLAARCYAGGYARIDQTTDLQEIL